MTQFDYVGGAGSAGCVVANRLTEDPNNGVARSRIKPEIQIPADCLKLGSEVDWGYFGTTTSTLARSRGKVLGAPVRLMACSMFVILTIMTTGRWETPVELPGCLTSRNLSTPHAVPTRYHGGS